MRNNFYTAAISAAIFASTGAFIYAEPSLAFGDAVASEAAAENILLLPSSTSGANAGIEIVMDDLVAEDIGETDPAKDDSLEDVLKAQAAKKAADQKAIADATKPKATPAAAIVEKTKPIRASSLASQVSKMGAPGKLDAETQCLAGAVFFESKGESLNGQLAVAHVVLNRAASGRFPNSICGVVYQRSQFSFVRGGRMPSINTGSQDWREAVAIAQIAKDGLWESPVGKALFFHATRVSPGWKLKRVATIENHVFYR
jgi:spore germination cell wall hydrolase CwlJ-like protein